MNFHTNQIHNQVKGPLPFPLPFFNFPAKKSAKMGKIRGHHAKILDFRNDFTISCKSVNYLHNETKFIIFGQLSKILRLVIQSLSHMLLQWL